jgi:hypothetical protein
MTKAQALQSLRPGAQWVLRGDDLEWLDTEQPQPTEAEITAEVARLQAEHERTEYQRKRAAEYPPMADYLDAVVKGDQAQIDAYIAACQAVKAKYPKPQ